MADMMTQDNTAPSLFGAVAISALVGVAAGMLLAPKSGRATRDDLIRKVREVQARSLSKVTETKDDVVEMTQDAATEARSQVEDATAKVDMQTPTRSRTRQAPS